MSTIPKKYKHDEVEEIKSGIEEAGVPVLCADLLIREYIGAQKDWKQTKISLPSGYTLEAFHKFIEQIEEAFGWSCYFEMESSFIWFEDGSWLEQYSEIAPYTDGESETHWYLRRKPEIPVHLQQPLNNQTQQ